MLFTSSRHREWVHWTPTAANLPLGSLLGKTLQQAQGKSLRSFFGFHATPVSSLGFAIRTGREAKRKRCASPRTTIRQRFCKTSFHLLGDNSLFLCPPIYSFLFTSHLCQLFDSTYFFSISPLINQINCKINIKLFYISYFVSGFSIFSIFWFVIFAQKFAVDNFHCEMFFYSFSSLFVIICLL